MNELRAKLELACSGAATSGNGIRCCGEAAESVVTDDPVAQAAGDDVVLTHTVVSAHAHRRSRYVRNSSKNKIIEVSMPQRAPETGLDEGDRIVRIYCDNRKTIWLCVDDADWALT